MAAGASPTGTRALGAEEISLVCAGHGGWTPLDLGRNLRDDFVCRLGG